MKLFLQPKTYIGRYAPSPTGPLHFGSLVTAVASYLEAKTQNGKWLLRMEDLDKPREVVGAANQILTTLECYGFEWDGPIIYQSQRLETYQSALEALKSKGLIYPCSCSRRDIANIAHAGIEGMVYPGLCRTGLKDSSKQTTSRIRVDATQVSFDDALQGHIQLNPHKEIGDFILQRADGLFAYQLAVVVDDAEQGINHVVRGADLMLSTARQILLQSALELPTPKYAHIPLALNAKGDKISSQTKATPISNHHVLPTLIQAFAFLNMPITTDIENIDDLWRWGVKHWQLSNINPQSRQS